ncbi:MAG: DUF4168 domain-containing protein [cyanobacterium endosymbiont of Rhopalodia musculus]|uniref:DUF4168 domain-containing protein n=1 Tax=cyanobacterium endosymbiont of Epithemia clementina EcSB TaxID=3034674 RepID=UPI00248090CA|nr:DUF4168 domain-containing protein [cyanobacterium endosymbiont of Epithemia clementina EcSB]WGT67687.1 DUF4168 domain-containing protein [cyanobacterium endosymbiont of Epithemia clementina EcSB]
MLKLILVGGVAGVLYLSVSLPVHGQIEARTTQFFEAEHSEISPLELRQFAQVLQQFQAIDYRTQQKMAMAIKKGGLSYERFMEIGQSQNNYNYAAGVQASLEELEKFQKTVSEVEEIIVNTEQKKERVIQSQGLAIKRFRQIETIISQDSKLQEKVQQMVGN